MVFKEFIMMKISIYNDFTDFGYDYEIHPAYRWALQPDRIQNLFHQIELMEKEDFL